MGLVEMVGVGHPNNNNHHPSPRSCWTVLLALLTIVLLCGHNHGKSKCAAQGLTCFALKPASAGCLFCLRVHVRGEPAVFILTGGGWGLALIKSGAAGSPERARTGGGGVARTRGCVRRPAY